MQPKYYGAAAEYNKPVSGGGGGLSGILKIFGIFVGAILLIAIAFTVVNSIGKGPSNEFARLVARTTELQTLLDKQKPNIRSSDLKTINATGQILMAGDVAALSEQLTVAFGAEGVPEDITAAEADPTIETTLKNAGLTGTFDKVYVGVLRDKIASSYDLANTLLGSASGDTQAAVQKTIDTLTSLDSQLEKLQI
jgi:hypothetical protein